MFNFLGAKFPCFLSLLPMILGVLLEHVKKHTLENLPTTWLSFL